MGAVIVQDGKALIVKRAHEPRKGEWSLPGGRVELGESLADATRREIKEETGLDVEVGPLIEVFDRIHRVEGPRAVSLRHRRLSLHAARWRLARRRRCRRCGVGRRRTTSSAYGVNEHAAARDPQGPAMRSRSADGAEGDSARRCMRTCTRTSKH